MTYRLAFGAILSRFLICFLVAGSSAAPAFASVEAALQAKIDSLSNFVDRPADRDALRTFYAERSYRPFWVDQSGPTHAAAGLIAELGRAGNWGLRSADFQAPAANAPLNEGRWPAENTAAAEYEISALVLKYARQARGGRIAEPDRMLSSYLDRRPVLPDPARVLALVTSAAAPDAALRSFHPQNEQFQKLHDLLAKLRAESGETAVTQIPAQGPSLVPGAKHVDIAAMRQRLGVTAVPGSENVYDATLAAAVKAFQSGADLDNDGIVGPATRKALNTVTTDRRASVVANMEQWRWMPDDLGATHLFVNVPAFSIDLVRDRVSVLQERVITGKSTTQTPIFSKQLTAIVLKPLWYLPDSIKLEKLLAAQRTGSPIEGEGYLVKHGSHIVDSSSVDWNTAKLREYSIYQPSGDGNALGDVKFLFPNKHSVYLHDTPNKALFEASTRLFSHGCIRLHNPLALAQRLLDADKGPGVWNVKSAIRKGDSNTQVMLDAPLPIHVAYFTVWIGKDGAPQYLGDPYGHEARVSLALDNKWDALNKGVDHLAAVDTKALRSVNVQGSAGLAAARARRDPSLYPLSGLFNAGPAPTVFAKRHDNGGVGAMIKAALER